jgi:hypothetical protein
LARRNYLLRAIKPVINAPRPSSPSSGSGEAVCGSLEMFSPACFFSASLGWLAAPAGASVVLAGGFCAAVAFCSLVAVPAADCEPAPTLLDGVWLLTGGVAGEVLLEAELVAGAADSWLVVEGEVAAGVLLAGLPVLLWACELAAMSLEGAVPVELGLADVPAAA